MLKEHLLYSLRLFDALEPTVVFSRREDGSYFVRYAPPDAPDKSVVLEMPAGLAKILNVESPPHQHPRRLPIHLILTLMASVSAALALLYVAMRKN